MDFVEVALPIGLNSLFTYSVPEAFKSTVYKGKRVLVNFNGRKITGFVIADGYNTDKFKIKPIEKIIDEIPMFNDKMLQFAEWISKYYFASLGEALSLMIPRGVRPKKLLYKQNNIEKNKLTSMQEEVYNGINADIAAGNKRFYIYGITGSGKTEIYFNMIEDTISKGKQVIFLVPEIALSYQTLGRLRDRFGDKCAVIHSALAGSERLSEFFRLKNGEAMIAVGPRSALFAPFDNVGLIIIDEEHESAYKSEESPRYHARSAALYLAKIHDAVLVLGSATPAIESWYHCINGYFKLYKLTKRYAGASLPEVKVINTESLAPYKHFSQEMTLEINNRLMNKEQIILLQNRRGFSNFIQCKDCKAIISCPRCSVSLTYHKTKNKLLCHRCGYSITPPEKCPECGSSKMNKVGAGTQRIEDEIKTIFPHARITRIDYDVVQSAKDLAGIFQAIDRKEIDIIIGTQMIAKGLHFPGIKFVGVIDADMFLNIPDFKAAERAFSLITQVSGRAGRTGTKGVVMIQTANPEHYSITTACTGDFENFYNNEIVFRDLMGMPPFKRLVKIVVRGIYEDKVKKNCTELKDLIDREVTSGVEVLGVAPCMLTKLNKNYRYQILIKSKRLESIQTILLKVLPVFKVSQDCYLEVDTDPVDLF